MRRIALCLSLPALAMQAPDPAPADLLRQAQGLWTTQGDLEGAIAKLEQIVALLTGPAAGQAPGDVRLLCETYNWLAALEDRHPPLKAKVPGHFKALLDLDPEFSLDRSVTPARLKVLFETEREARFPKVEISVLPEGGLLLLDGRPTLPGVRRLTLGAHRLSYQRPGYKSLEKALDLQPGPAEPVRLELVRSASTIAFNVLPIGAEILLDGKVLGKAEGQAGPEARPWAEKHGVPLETLSAPFQLQEVLPGKHRLEVRSPCHVTRRIDIPEDFTTPLADHLLDPIKLESSAAKLTLTSPVKGGEAFVDGDALGPLPLTQSRICPGPRLLTVRFPTGGYTRSVVISDGESLELVALPKPRLAFLGLEGNEDFPGRARLETQFRELAKQLEAVAVLPARPGEGPEEAKARIMAGREAELLLEARTQVRAGVTLVDLRLATPDGLEEHLWVKPLDQDPLAAWVQRMNAAFPLTAPTLGLVCLDVPGEPGPWVLQASEAALKAGLRLHQPITSLEGQPTPTLGEFRALLAKVTTPSVTLTQGATPLALPLLQGALELPLQSTGLSYPMVVADLRLRLLGAQGSEAGLLRLNLARAYLHFDKPDRALEVLREAVLPAGSGVSKGNVAYLMGICLLRLGTVYIPEAIQSFKQALQDPGATLFGPDGPPVAPLARAALQTLQP